MRPIFCDAFALNAGLTLSRKPEMILIILKVSHLKSSAAAAVVSVFERCEHARWE